jgi:hypothetical protein
MSVPYQLVNLVFILAAVGLAIAGRSEASLARGLPARWFRAADGRPQTQRVRRGAVGLLIIVALAFIGLRAAGAPLGPSDQPLNVDGAWGGNDPSLLAIQDDGIDPGEFIFAFQPGGQIRTGLTLANNGPAPLTVTGIEQPVHLGADRSFELLLPPGPLGPDLPPVNPGDGPVWTSEPFHPFEIPAHADVALGLAVNFDACPGAMPVPTLAPGSSLEPQIDPSFTSGFTAASEITLDYTVLGISRSAKLTLHSGLAVVTNGLIDCPAL